jgi:hypothetical protein
MTPSRLRMLVRHGARIGLVCVVGLPTLVGCSSTGGGGTTASYPYNDFYYDRWRWGSCCYTPGYPVGPPARPPVRPEHPIARPPVNLPRPPVARPPRPTPRPAMMR